MRHLGKQDIIICIPSTFWGGGERGSYSQELTNGVQSSTYVQVERAEELVRANLDLALRSDPDHRNDGVHEDGLGVHRNMRVGELTRERERR